MKVKEYPEREKNNVSRVCKRYRTRKFTLRRRRRRRKKRRKRRKEENRRKEDKVKKSKGK